MIVIYNSQLFTLCQIKALEEEHEHFLHGTSLGKLIYFNNLGGGSFNLVVYCIILQGFFFSCLPLRSSLSV